MTVPLSDTHLTERAEILAALSAAGAFCGECGFQPGETGCADCVRVRELYADAVMPIVDRLRGVLAHAEAERNCFAMAIMFARGGTGWSTPWELSRGIDEILATGPAAPAGSGAGQ